MKKLIQIIIVIIIVISISACKKDNNQPAVTDLSGNWAIIGTLVTTTNPDPNAPQAGFQAPDNWNIALNAGIPKLTTSKGSVEGSGINNGYHFEGEVTIYPSPLVWMSFKIDVFPSVNYNQIYGTEEFTYYGLDGVGNPHLLGTESWTIAGVKQ